MTVTALNRKVRLARLAIAAMMHRLTLACAASSVLTCVLAVFEPECGFAHLKAHAPYMLALLVVAAGWYVWKRRRYEEAEGRSALLGALYLDSVVLAVALIAWLYDHFGVPGLATFVGLAVLMGYALDRASRRTYRLMLDLDDGSLT
ncbi:hypothetical protein AB4Y45_33505 [Paraburkholderia sp. EG287A]|uniref:hypothetical protein n=1 Tax=Paraburkholderia sp. EG287A TaxID=3237012 RepID=UPI0034D2B208